MAETERKKPSKSKKVFVIKAPKLKRAGHRDICYRKKVSDDEESLVKNADVDQQDSSEISVRLLPFHREIETLGELGSKESRNYAEKSEEISTCSNVGQSTDDVELKVDEGALRMSEIRLLEANRECCELIIKSFDDVAINSDENDNFGVNSGKIEVCYSQERPNEEVAVGRIETLQAESSITAHVQRSVPTSAEIDTKTKRSNTFANKSDSRQSENGRHVKTIKRTSKKRWKKTKKSKKMDAETETLPTSISGDKDSEIIEILDMDEDDRKQMKKERRKKRRKRAKKMAKTVGLLRSLLFVNFSPQNKKIRHKYLSF